ncbi:MAG TPA: head GIN domain-containing protein [Aridibacter sp.]|nr:head GIN domain-containing protein [Aridibacter sp.]
MKYMKQAIFALALAAFAIAASAATAAAQDNYRSEARNVSGFTGVDIGGAMEAEITVGGSYEVIIEAKEDVLPRIITEVRNGSLVVKHDKAWKEKTDWKQRGKVKVTVSLPTLDNLDISGASAAKVTGVNSDKIDIDVSGASSVSIDGSARSATIDISGASNIKAIGFTTDTADIDASGASSIKLNVVSDLRADASGASSVCYGGSPRVQKDTSGSASVSGGCGAVAQ